MAELGHEDATMRAAMEAMANRETVGRTVVRVA
jgi:hypothetical protein